MPGTATKQQLSEALPEDTNTKETLRQSVAGLPCLRQAWRLKTALADLGVAQDVRELLTDQLTANSARPRSLPTCLGCCPDDGIGDISGGTLGIGVHCQGIFGDYLIVAAKANSGI